MTLPFFSPVTLTSAPEPSTFVAAVTNWEENEFCHAIDSLYTWFENLTPAEAMVSGLQVDPLTNELPPDMAGHDDILSAGETVALAMLHLLIAIGTIAATASRIPLT